MKADEESVKERRGNSLMLRALGAVPRRAEVEGRTRAIQRRKDTGYGHISYS